jgi:hypothetical protein
MAQLMRRLELDVEWLNLAELGSCERPCGKATVIQLRAGMGTVGWMGGWMLWTSVALDVWGKKSIKVVCFFLKCHS